MKKVLSLILVMVLLVSGMFVLTGCDNNSEIKNGKELTYEYNMFNAMVTVPQDSNYEFTKEKPENKIYFDGVFYLVGDKINIAFKNDSFYGYKDNSSTTFKEFVKYLQSEDYTGTRKPTETIKIGGKDAVRFEYKSGGKLYGYEYFIEADDIVEKGMIKIIVTTSDFSSENVDTTFTDTEVQAIINSLKFSK